MERIKARLTTLSPTFIGGQEKTGNIRLPFMIHLPHDKKRHQLDREKAETLLKCLSGFYRNCDFSGFGQGSYSEAFRNRLFVAACSTTISQMFSSLRGHLPMDNAEVYQYMTKFAFDMTEMDNRLLLAWIRQNIDIVAMAAIYMVDSYKFKEGFEINDDMLALESDYLTPVLPGNSLRGLIRDMMMAYMTAIVYDEPDPNKVFGPRVYHILTSGGMLTSRPLLQKLYNRIKEIYKDIDAGKGDTKYINIEAIRDIRKYLPFFSILGGMTGNEAVAGKIDVNFAKPHCFEYEAQYTRSGMSLLKEVFTTRRDDYEGEITEEWLTEIKSQSVQMITSYLAFQSGVEFDWSVDHYYLSGDERAFLDLALFLFRKHGKVGAKNAAGFGEIQVEYLDGYDPQPDKGKIFLSENTEKIKQILTVLGE